MFRPFVINVVAKLRPTVVCRALCNKSVFVNGLEGFAPLLHTIFVCVVVAIISPEGEDVHIGVAFAVIESVENTCGNEDDLIAFDVDNLVVQLELALTVEDVIDLVLFVSCAAQSLVSLNGAVVDLDNIVAAVDNMVEYHSGFIRISIDKGLNAVDFYLKGRQFFHNKSFLSIVDRKGLVIALPFPVLFMFLIIIGLADKSFKLPMAAVSEP